VPGDLPERTPRSFAFGPFILVPERQLLVRGGTAVRIGGRALDLLTALVERPGEVVTKRELMARVWSNTVVDEANLKVNVAALRRTLGAPFRPAASRRACRQLFRSVDHVDFLMAARI